MSTLNTTCHTTEYQIWPISFVLYLQGATVKNIFFRGALHCTIAMANKLCSVRKRSYGQEHFFRGALYCTIAMVILYKELKSTSFSQGVLYCTVYNELWSINLVLYKELRPKSAQGALCCSMTYGQ